MANCTNCGSWLLFHHSHCKNCDKNVWQRKAESKNEYGDVGRPYRKKPKDEDVPTCAGCGGAIWGWKWFEREGKPYHKRHLPER